MNTQYSNYLSKQPYQKKAFQNISKKVKPRQSEPPVFQTGQDFHYQNPSETKLRKPRPSEIGFESPSNKNLTRNQMYQMLVSEVPKRNANQLKNQTMRNREDYNFDKKIQTSLKPTINRDLFQSPTSNKVISSNRFLSPELKIGQQHPATERKYSQNIDDPNFFKGHKPSAPNLNSKAMITKNDNINQKNYNISSTQSSNIPPQPQSHQISQKRTPRFSQPGNYSMEVEDQSTNTIYNKKSQAYNQQRMKPKEVASMIKNPKQFNPIQKKIISVNKLEKQKQEAPSEFSLGGNSAFKKIKELKQTVSTHSTFDSKKMEIGLSSPTFKKQSKFQERGQKPQQLKVSDFVRGKELGSGKFGQVCVVKHKLTGFICAMKSIPKAMIREQNIINQLIRELKIQTYLDHPNIIKLYGFFHDKQNIYLLLELGSAGQLYKVIKQRQRLSESATSYVMKQVCQAIKYLHVFKIIHRDLKPENIVIQNGTVKICDFGWAVCRGGQLRSTFCGTPLYVSPEILKGQMYDEKIDLWAIGILTYQLLFGNIPFQINTEEELIKIVKQDIVFPADIKVSLEAKDFILKILKKNPDERLKISELLQHDFLKKSPEIATELQ